MDGKSKVLRLAGLLTGAALLAHTACASPTAGAQPPAATSADDQEQRTISVSGTGTASARPDRVVLRLGVETTAETARQAVSDNSRHMAAVIGTLREAGVPDENIQTQTVQLRARYETVRTEFGQADQPQPVGYTASNVVEARTADLEAVGQLLDQAVQAGANRIEGLRFELSDPTPLLQQAREAAWHDAEQKAQQLASLADVELARVMTINEATTAPRPVARVALELADVAVPIEPGAQDIHVDLQVAWSIR